MNDALVRLFREFDEGKLTRRELIHGLAMLALVSPLRTAIGQGRGAGADSTRRIERGNVPRDTIPAPPPFAPTEWKTVWLDHLSYQTTDYKKAAAFYATLMGWKIRSDNGQQVVMDIADRVGSVIIRGGYQPPPAPPAPPVTDTAGGGRGRGRGNPPNGSWDNFCWGIQPWDTRKVETELAKRGLNPVADHSGDFKSFHVKDPDGFDVQVSNGTKADRWKGPARGQLPAPAPFESPGWKTVWLDHISFQVSDYKRSVAFYEALLGWKPRALTGNQAMTDIGDVGGIIIRGGGGGGGRGRGGGADSSGRGAAAPPPAPRMARIDHISFGIEPWDADKVEAELLKRGLGRLRPDGHLTPDTGGGGDIHTSKFQSYHTPDPFGWDLQISNITFETRTNT